MPEHMTLIISNRGPHAFKEATMDATRFNRAFPHAPLLGFMAGGMLLINTIAIVKQ
jgi:hypothetical protein